MCGIVGILNLKGEPVSTVILHKMVDAVTHRGPDNEGYHIDGSVGFGHRRLAIIDRSAAGLQPMLTQDSRFMISYNGEVFNFQELRVELEGLGHSFKSRTDSEVVLHSYAEWGKESIKRFNGMFAFGIWDGRQRMLFLARDRYGIKPLYYYHDENVFIFASEIKALLRHPALKAQVNSKALLEYFTFQNIFTDQTLFKGVKLLPPGHTAFLKVEEPGKLQLQKYWDFDFREPAGTSNQQECEEEFKRLFAQGVRRQLVSDVPVGAYLSGGIDSGAITAVAAQQIPYLASFTCGFDLSSVSESEMGFDERKRAEHLSYFFKTELYEVVLKAGDMQRILNDLVWHLEDLRVGQCYPNYYVSRLASKFVKVVLSGTGGDELFAGYPWRYYRGAKNEHFKEYIQRYYKSWQRLVPEETIQELFQPDVWKEMKDISTAEIFSAVMSSAHQEPKTPEDYINNSLYFEAKTFLHGLLMVDDKLSMTHGLECRVPFLDNDLVDFAMTVPVRYKLRNLGQTAIWVDENEVRPKRELYFEKTSDGKLIVRNVLGQYMPADYVTNFKQGFSAPDASWFRKESLHFIRSSFIENRARIYDYLREDTVRELVNEHLNGEKNRRLLIWSLLSFEWWLKNFVG